MTTIRIDPDELAGVASGVRGAAAEVADVGAALQGCCCAPMPPALEASVTRMVATADVVLDGIAVGLDGAATDLLDRAAVAGQDSLTAASAASGPATGVVPAGLVVGGITATMASSASGDAEAAPAPAPGTIVGGGLPGWTTMTIGGGSLPLGGPPAAAGGLPADAVPAGLTVGDLHPDASNPGRQLFQYQGKLYTESALRSEAANAAAGFTTTYIGGGLDLGPQIVFGPGENLSGMDVAGATMAVAADADAQGRRARELIDQVMADPAATDFQRRVALAADQQLNDSGRRLVAETRPQAEARLGRQISLSEWGSWNTGGWDGTLALGPTTDPVLTALGLS